MEFRLPLKHFFRLQERGSNEQLATDFEEFPPYPLNCTRLDSVVRIVRASGVGGMVNCSVNSRK